MSRGAVFAPCRPSTNSVTDLRSCELLLPQFYLIFFFGERERERERERESLSVSVSVSVYVSVSVSVSVCLSVCLSVSLPLSLPLSPPTFLSPSLSICGFVCVSLISSAVTYACQVHPSQHFAVPGISQLSMCVKDTTTVQLGQLDQARTQDGMATTLQHTSTTWDTYSVKQSDDGTHLFPSIT